MTSNSPEAKPLQNVFFLGRCAKAVEQANIDGIRGKSLFEGVVVLLSQNGSRGEQSHLLVTGRNSLKNGTDGHFGFPKTHVTTNQSIHGAIAFQVTFDILNRFKFDRGWV